MARSGAKFGRKQEEAIAALLSKGTVEEAARIAGIGKRTLSRWLQVPEFQAAYRQARHDAFSQSVARLQQGSVAAATVLLKLTLDPSTPASVRVRAADCVLNHATKAIETEAIEARALAVESNKDLLAARRMELQGILRGILESGVLYHRERIADPPDVTVPERRREESDRLQEFFQDRCMVAVEGDVDSWKKERCWVPVADLYPTYAAWAAATGDKHPFRKGPFEERLHELGREKGRVRPDRRRETKQVWVWLGIRFNTAGDD
jgi:transposase-like protein